MIAGLLRCDGIGNALRQIVGALGIACLAAIGSVAGSSPSFAAELVMFEEPGCPYCRRWRAEVGPGYPKSPEGKRAPLRVVDLTNPRPNDFRLDAPIRYSPTFVLVEDGREVGRITGYPGADFFWPMLENLLAKLGPEKAPPAKPQASPASFIRALR